MNGSGFEYGIAWTHNKEIHRTGMTLHEAKEWIREWEEDGGMPNTFYITERFIGPWIVHSRPKYTPPRRCNCGDYCKPGNCINVPA